ncbi:MAG: dephospho-CoA kinase [Candidatus Algichlamydia australiensis]|nr:dephospho-CoA kinase [Chlamydiales bacterium]
MAKIGESVRIKRIAITGVPGSGKSTVAKIFEESGAYRVDADEITHRLLNQDSQLRQQIKNEFGQEVFSGNLRDNLAKVVFSDPVKLQRLEKIIHPKIIQHLLSEMKEAEKQHKLCVAEVPLLFEVNWEKYFDATICVTATSSLCLNRFGKGEEEYKKRTARQLSQADKARRADHVLENNQNMQTLKTHIEDLGIK